MNAITKIFIVLVCFGVCAGAAIFSPKEKARNGAPEGELAPVNNHSSGSATWLRV